MHQSRGPGTARSRLCDAKRPGGVMVSMMEQYPIDQNSLAAPIRVEAKKGALPEPQRFRPLGASEDVNAALPAVHSEQKEVDVSVSVATVGATPPTTRKEPQQQSNTSPYHRGDLDERIRKETLRRAHLMIAQQLRVRQVEVRLQQWAASSCRNPCGGQAVESKAEVAGGERSDVDTDAAFVMQTVTTEGKDKAAATDAAPLVSIRSITGIASGRSNYLDNKTDKEVRQGGLPEKGGLLRQLHHHPKDTVRPSEVEECVRLQGCGVVPKEVGSARSPRHPPASIPHAGLFPTEGTAKEGGESARNDEAPGMAVRRLICVPNHNRGLYAALRSSWKRHYEARVLARMLFRKRARSMSWWKAADSRDGLLAAAKSFGLTPATYQALMSCWMAMEDGAQLASISSAPGLASSQGLPSWAGAAAATASLLFPGDERLLGMLELAQLLGQLETRLQLSPEEIARLMELDLDSLRQELERLLGQDATTLLQGMLPLGGSMATNGQEHASLRELAKVMLQERRNATEAQRKRLGMDAILRLQKGPRFQRSRTDLAQLREKKDFSAEIGFPPLFHKSSTYEADMQSMTPEERVAYLASMKERREHQTAAEAAGKRVSADPFAHLPPIRGADAGEAMDGRPRTGAGLHRRVPPTAASLKDSFSGFFDDDSCVGWLNSFDMTQRPGGNGATAGAGPEEEEDSGMLLERGRWGYEWLKKQQQQRQRGRRTSEQMDSESDDDKKNGIADGNKITSGGFPRASIDFVDTFLPSRKRRQRQQQQQQQQLQGAEEEEAWQGADGDGSRTLPCTADGVSLHAADQQNQDQTRGEQEGGTRSTCSSRAGFYHLWSGDRSGMTSAAGGRWKPLELLRTSNSSSARPLSADKHDFSSTYANGDGDLEGSEFCSFFDNDDEELMMFLATFPEEEEHVRLRMEAKGVLHELNDASSVLVNYATNIRAKLQAGLLPQQQQQRQQSFDMETVTSEEAMQMMQLKVNVDELRRRFEMEAREQYADLWSTLQDLRQQVLAQEVFIDNCSKDLHNLSHPAPGAKQDTFALQLTSDVNEYARKQHLDPRHLRETVDRKKDYATAVRAYLESFAFTRGKHVGRDVACQCKPEDLDYVDEYVRRTEEQMEDLYFHAHELLSAIRLTIIAVTNLMGFHASLELESTCRRCFCIFDSPRTLWPCGHTFCHQCLPNMITDVGELLCDECGSLCEVGYTPNLALELVASYQVMRHEDYGDEDDEEEDRGSSSNNNAAHRSTVEGVLAALLRDLMSTQSTLASVPRADAARNDREASTRASPTSDAGAAATDWATVHVT